jgi:BCD family chlorophyll transporter-like MFS transporter
LKLIQVIQGTALTTACMTLIAMWQQEPRRRGLDLTQEQPTFTQAWRALRSQGGWGRRLTAAGLGSFAFSMQDVLLEPYGGQILGMSVSQTTLLTALFAGGGIIGFLLAGRLIGRGADPHGMAGNGALCGAVAFAGIALAAPTESGLLFCAGVALVGFGAGLFAHGTLTGCMRAAPADQVGLALGAWGAVQASCAGAALALGGVVRDVVSGLAQTGALGTAMNGPATGYITVYLTEIVLLFATLAAIGPLVRRTPGVVRQSSSKLGFAEPVSLSSQASRGPT